MSKFEQKDNSGAMFAVEEKKTDKHPDREGSALIGGREYWVNGWLKKSKDGKPYLSLAFKPKEAKPQKYADPAKDSSVPF